MGKRRQARELALHALYLADLAPGTSERAFAMSASDSQADSETSRFSRELFERTRERQTELDERIQGAAENWTLARMAAVDRNILRLAAYELIHCPETPVNVIIDEALEIARKFSTDDSTRFINGVLDALKSLRA